MRFHLAVGKPLISRWHSIEKMFQGTSLKFHAKSNDAIQIFWYKLFNLYLIGNESETGTYWLLTRCICNQIVFYNSIQARIPTWYKWKWREFWNSSCKLKCENINLKRSKFKLVISHWDTQLYDIVLTSILPPNKSMIMHM